MEKTDIKKLISKFVKRYCLIALVLEAILIVPNKIIDIKVVSLWAAGVIDATVQHGIAIAAVKLSIIKLLKKDDFDKKELEEFFKKIKILPTILATIFALINVVFIVINFKEGINYTTYSKGYMYFHIIVLYLSGIFGPWVQIDNIKYEMLEPEDSEEK